mmetsp:Transcript_31687/g.48511  ORF Transcript_31687/g.48511 Transcript_31687/m.48511 type:complete len:109 (-) Transcript_31687:1618-1944(-)
MKAGSGHVNDDESSSNSSEDEAEHPLPEPSHVVNLTKEEVKREEKGKIISNENEESNQVGWAIYRKYFFGYYGPGFFACLLVILTVLLGSRLTLDYLIGQWANEDPEP